jgi:AAA+ ATPase superfamily predicted ATPase
MKVIDREWEKGVLDKYVAASELIVVYGRRRVGKTWLVKHHLGRKGLFFYTSGQSGKDDKPAVQRTQLRHFDKVLVDCFKPRIQPARSTTWSEAIDSLLACVEAAEDRPILLFFDELPWLAGESDLDGVLEHAWDTRLSYMLHVTLVVCGSAATWMRDYRNRRKGTGSRAKELNLKPFNLLETQIYLAEKKN